MNLMQNLRIAVLMTIVTTVLLGVAYPLAVTGLAQLLFRDQANGQLLDRDPSPAVAAGGQVIGSRLIGQAFASPRYFHGRPSAAGAGYDAANSGGSNLGPTNKKLIDALAANVAAAKKENPSAAACPQSCPGVPIDFVTASASGLDPEISPAAALFQVARVARARAISEEEVRQIVTANIQGRQLGFLGEPRVNVLLLNLALDDRYKSAKR